MTRQSHPRIGKLVAMALCIISPSAFTQSPQAYTPEIGIATDESVLEARAAEVREAFVHKFGTAGEIAAYDHPGDKAKIKRPKVPKDGKYTPDSMAAMMEYATVHQAPTQLYDGVFNSVFFAEAYGDSIGTRPTAGDGLETTARVLFQVESLIPVLGETIANRTLANGYQASRAANESERIEKMMKARSAAIERIAAFYLETAEADQYRTGSYIVRARLLFKAANIALRRRTVPNAVVLMLCDPSPQNGNGAGAQVYELYKDHMKDEPRTLAQRWLMLSRLQSRFIQDGVDAFTTDAPPEEFLARASLFLHIFDASKHAALLGTLGAEGEKEYDAADASKKEVIKKTNMAMYIAADVLIGAYVSQK